MPAVLSKINVQFPCNLCCKPVAKNHRALCCDICDQWVHIKCNSVSPRDYELLKTSVSPWFCVRCVGCIFPRSSKLFNDAMPSSLEDDSDHDDDSDSDSDSDSAYDDGASCPSSHGAPTSHTEDASSRRAAFLNSLFLPDSSENSDDPDQSTDDSPLNCRYYDTNSLIQTLKDFNPSHSSFFHLNIASLPLHADNLHTLFHNLGFNFSVVGITETKISTSSIPDSLVLPNYRYLHTPSKSIKGGSALFIRDDLTFFPRTDLNKFLYKDNELESCFAEFSLPQ